MATTTRTGVTGRPRAVRPLRAERASPPTLRWYDRALIAAVAAAMALAVAMLLTHWPFPV